MASNDPVVTAGLYEAWTLDNLSDLGSTCGAIFEANPQQFKGVSAELADKLAVLRYRTGYSEEHLSAAQRQALVVPLLGASDGTRHTDETSAFHVAARALRKAAVDFVQRSFDTGERQLRNAFRDAAKSFHAHLRILEGAVTASAVRRLQVHLTTTVGVLRESQFTGGLGLPPAPGNPWPLGGVLDGDGAALVEELERRSVAMGLISRDPIDAAGFIATQRIAVAGADTIAGIFKDPDMTDDAAADAAINVAYRWWTAIRDFRGE